MSFQVVRHPLIAHKLGLLRSADCAVSKFRQLAREIASLLTYEATRDLETEPATISGWAGPLTAERLSGKKVVVVPILRAGLGLLEGVLDLIPSARVNIVGIYRDEASLEAVQYYHRMSADLAHRLTLVVDPMLATGHSLAATLDLVKRSGGRRVRAICLVAAPEGVRHLAERHPDVPIYAAALDDRLDAAGYILPGLGDAGDRLFGTR